MDAVELDVDVVDADLARHEAHAVGVRVEGVREAVVLVAGGRDELRQRERER